MGSALWPAGDNEGLVPQSTFDLVITGPRPHVAYQKDPVGWMVDKLGLPRHTIEWSLNAGYDTHVWDGTVDPLVVACHALRDWQDCTIESGTGTGKSYIAAALALWFLACWEGAQVFTFAPTASQLRLYIWRYIREFWPKFVSHFPTATLTTESLRMKGGTDDTWAMHPKPVQVKAGEDVSTRAAGMHAAHMLLIYEETPGIDPAVLMAGKNTCTAPHNIRFAIGNPNHKLDALHKMSEEVGVTAVRCSSLDHPNVVGDNAFLIPGAISLQSVITRRMQFGENDPIYLSRVRGLSPDQAANALIRLEWLKAAAARWLARKEATAALEDEDGPPPEIQYDTRSVTAPKSAAPKVVVLPLTYKITGKGVDVANSEHGDERCIVDFSYNAVMRVESEPCPDANALGRQVCREMDEQGLAPERVGVDATGVGAGTVNECRAKNKPVMAIHFGGKPMQMAELLPDGQRYEWTADVNKFENLRAQMYWQIREDLRKGVIDMEENELLWQELTIVTFEDYPTTKIIPKDQIRAKLGRSPDSADALVMANWVRERAVRPEKVEDLPGHSLGIDPETGRPRERESAEAMVDRLMQDANRYPLANRYRPPYRGPQSGGHR